MLSTDDKRDFYRMNMDCPVIYTVNGGADRYEGTAKDLSAKGLLIWAENAVDADDVLTVQVRPVTEITPPLHAKVRVVRCSPIEGARGTYAIACETQEILPS